MSDIVYIVKNAVDPYELRYSLRSLRNFPHDKVWIYGGKPEGIQADKQVTMFQQGISKWQKVRNTLEKVCMNDEITEFFWLFNDDFFCMKKCEGMPPVYHGTLHDRVQELKQRHGASKYMTMLTQTESMLKRAGMPTRNYAVHMPMLISREKGLEVLKAFGSFPMFRSLYGNYMNIGGEDREDVKIYRREQEPDHDAEWLSTTDDTFAHGLVGRYIRQQFTEACEYEVR